jgi:hypothetical protein
MELQGRNPAGSIQTVQLDPLFNLLVTEMRGRYAELSRQGRIFSSYVATVATSLVSTSTIGNMVWNPPGSGVRLEMLKWTSQIVATSATCTGIAIAGGFQTTAPTTTTAATTTGSTNIRATTLKAGSGQAFSIATVLVAPVVLFPLHHNTAAINTVGMEIIAGDLEGIVTVEEGGFVTLCALGAAAAASGHTSGLLWAEIPTR